MAHRVLGGAQHVGDPLLGLGPAGVAGQEPGADEHLGQFGGHGVVEGQGDAGVDVAALDLEAQAEELLAAGRLVEALLVAAHRQPNEDGDEIDQGDGVQAQGDVRRAEDDGDEARADGRDDGGAPAAGGPLGQDDPRGQG